MMRHGVATAFAAMGALAACQVVSPGEETVTQAASGDFCQATMPEPKPWDGEPVKPAGETEAWVLWPNTDDKSIKLDQEWTVALVDNKAADVPIAYFVSNEALPKLVRYMINGRIGGPGVYPPPDPCRIPQLCAPMLAAYGQVLQSAAGDALEMAKSCEKK